MFFCTSLCNLPLRGESVLVKKKLKSRRLAWPKVKLIHCVLILMFWLKMVPLERAASFFMPTQSSGI